MNFGGFEDFIYVFIYIDTNNSGFKVPGHYKAEFFGQVSLQVPDRKHSGRQLDLKALRSQ